MLKNKNRFASNGVYHALQKTGFVGAGINGRHSVDLSELEKRKSKKDADLSKPKGRPLFDDEEPDQDELDPTHEDGDCDDPKEHMRQIAKHAKTLKKVSADIGHRIVEMHKMGLE